MRYRAPNSVCFPIDTENSDRYSCASGRSASFGITAQAIDPAVERHEYTVNVNHTDGTDVTVANRISSECLFIRILRRLLYRGCYLDVFFVDAVHTENLYENALSGLEISRCIHNSLVTQFPQRYVHFHTENVRKDTCAYNRNDSRFRSHTGVNNVIAIPVC